MSMRKSVSVVCDKCGTYHSEGETKEGTREARAEAKATGWKLGKSKDFCPSCRKDIEAAVKAAQAGEIA